MRKILNNKLLFIIPLFLIMIISFFDMYNAKYLSSLYTNNFYKQILWFILGFITFFIFKKVNNKYLFKYSFIIYLISILLLICCLLFGSSINGAKAWLSFKSLSFQPSELMKLSLALFLSNYATNSKYNNIKNELLFIINCFIITIIPSLLVFLEPDTGAIIFYFLILLSILIAKRIHKFWFIIFSLLLILGINLFIILYIINKDLLINLLGTGIFYRVERIITFSTMSSYQLDNALIGIGATSFFKFNLGSSSLYIPEAPTDFIFAFTITNFGFISSLLLLLSYLFMDIYLINKYFNTNKNNIKYFFISFLSIFIFTQCYNIAMNLGLLPIMGIPLPFLSYGGSNLIIYFAFLGIISSNKAN